VLLQRGADPLRDTQGVGPAEGHRLAARRRGLGRLGRLSAAQQAQRDAAGVAGRGARPACLPSGARSTPSAPPPASSARAAGRQRRAAASRTCKRPGGVCGCVCVGGGGTMVC
jgi:hypothetical protein